jgi:hypothetical protein
MLYRKKIENISGLFPVKEYKSPRYPVYTETCDNPALLKKLPSRWQKSAKVISCLGLIGALTLTGCPHLFYYRCDVCGELHHGGSGTPIYLVYLTEQEALSIIQTRAEASGLDLSAEPPDYSVEVYDRKIGLDFFDEEKKVALAFIYDEWYTNWVAELAKEEFAKLDTGISIGVLYNPVEDLHCFNAGEDKKAEARENIRKNLVIQVHKFIEWLQAQGIIH